MRIPDRGGVRWCLAGVRSIGERVVGGCGYIWWVESVRFGVDSAGDNGGDETMVLVCSTSRQKSSP